MNIATLKKDLLPPTDPQYRSRVERVPFFLMIPGVETSRARLVAGNLKGIPFITEVETCLALGLKYGIITPVPAFVDSLSVHINDGLVPGVGFRALETEDVDPLAKALSELNDGLMVGIMAKGRVLKAWEAGRVVVTYSALGELCLGLTDEEIEQAKFKEV